MSNYVTPMKDANEIVDALYSLKRRKTGTTALTICINQNGYEIGIADREVRGYTPTGIVIPIPNYDKAEKVVDEVNGLLFPNQSLKENYLIVASSMRLS